MDLLKKGENVYQEIEREIEGESFLSEFLDRIEKSRDGMLLDLKDTLEEYKSNESELEPEKIDVSLENNPELVSKNIRNFGFDKYFHHLLYLRGFLDGNGNSELVNKLRESTKGVDMELHCGCEEDLFNYFKKLKDTQVYEHISSVHVSKPNSDLHFRFFVLNKNGGEMSFVISTPFKQRAEQIVKLAGLMGVNEEKFSYFIHSPERLKSKYENVVQRLLAEVPEDKKPNSCCIGSRHGLYNHLAVSRLLNSEELVTEDNLTDEDREFVGRLVNSFLKRCGNNRESFINGFLNKIHQSEIEDEDKKKIEFYLNSYQFEIFFNQVENFSEKDCNREFLNLVVQYDEFIKKMKSNYVNVEWFSQYIFSGSEEDKDITVYDKDTGPMSICNIDDDTNVLSMSIPYGDSIKDLYRVTKNEGIKKFFITGSIGSFKGSNNFSDKDIGIGSIVMPGAYLDKDGKKVEITNLMIPDKEFVIKNVWHDSVHIGVDSVLDESEEWINDSIGKGAQTVDVEMVRLMEVTEGNGVGYIGVVTDTVSISSLKNNKESKPFIDNSKFVGKKDIKNSFNQRDELLLRRIIK